MAKHAQTICRNEKPLVITDIWQGPEYISIACVI